VARRSFSSKTQNTVRDKRVAPRRRVLLGSKIAHSDGDFFVDCLIKDISAAGARVSLDGQHLVPDTVNLVFFRDRLVYESRVAWRAAPEFGLEFLKIYRFDEVSSAGLRRVIADSLPADS
jgi:hypothetical protein